MRLYLFCLLLCGFFKQKQKLKCPKVPKPPFLSPSLTLFYWPSLVSPLSFSFIPQPQQAASPTPCSAQTSFRQPTFLSPSLPITDTLAPPVSFFSYLQPPPSSPMAAVAIPAPAPLPCYSPPSSEHDMQCLVEHAPHHRLLSCNCRPTELHEL